MIPTRQERALPYLIFVLSLVSFQAYRLFVGSFSILQSYVAFGVLYGFLLSLFFLFVVVVEDSAPSRYGFVTFGRNATVTAILLAVLMVGVYTFVVIEPGFIFGFAQHPNPSVIAFGFFLLSSPLVALAEEAIYRGYIFRKLATWGPLTSALLLSSGLYALQQINPLALESLGLNGAAQYVSQNVLSPFVLGIVMGLFFYKSGWSLLGPVIARAGILLQSNLSPVLPKTAGFEFSFIFVLLGSAALIVLINLLVREPRFMARRYLEFPVGPKFGRFRQRAKSRAAAKRTFMEISIIGVVTISAIVGSQSVLSSSFHLSAIASGSMRPALGIGTLVIVQTVSNQAQIHVGDIVEYNPTTVRGPLVHRVVDIKSTTSGPIYTARGDNNTAPDPAPFDFGRILGKVVFTVPLLGYLVLSPPLAAALIAFLFVSSLFSSSFKRPKRRTGRSRGA